MSIFNKLFFLLIFLSISCASKKLLSIYRIELNEGRDSGIGIPITASNSHIYPSFNDKNIYKDSLNHGNIIIEKLNKKYMFTYVSQKDTIKGQLMLFPYPFTDYVRGIDIETLADRTYVMYNVKRFYRVGVWEFRTPLGIEYFDYSISFEKMKKNVFTEILKSN